MNVPHSQRTRRPYCNLPARSLGYYRQSGFLFCPPQLKDLLGSSGGLTPRFLSSGDCERAIWLLPPDFPFRSSVPDPPDYPTFFARRAVSFVRSFPPGPLLPFHYSCSGTNDNAEGRKGRRAHRRQWTVRRLSQFGSNLLGLSLTHILGIVFFDPH